MDEEIDDELLKLFIFWQDAQVWVAANKVRISYSEVGVGGRGYIVIHETNPLARFLDRDERFSLKGWATVVDVLVYTCSHVTLEEFRAFVQEATEQLVKEEADAAMQLQADVM